MKKVFALAIVAFAVFGFMAAPSFAEALSDEQQNALTMLLRSFGADDSTIQNFQGAVLGATTGPTDDYGSDGTSTSGIYCPKLTATMQRGARDAATGGQVTELQLFLSDYFNLNEEDIATGFFGKLSQSYVVKFQQEKGLPAFGIAGSLTRAKIAEACGRGQTGTTATIPTNPTTPSTPSVTTYSNTSINRNLGTIPMRAIVANVDEAGTKFTQSKLSEVEQALQRLNTFVQQSSYGKAQLQWRTSGVYELGSGVCSRASYGEKVDELVLRALQAADRETPLTDYSFYVIVHPLPNCSDGVQWSFEGKGQFTAYALNGRTVHLRGVHISDLSDQYLFHEFGHSLAYQPNTGIGHPDYMNCPVVSSGGATTIPISSSCPRVFDFYNGILPVFTLMSKLSTLSDFSAIEKEIAGWLTSSDIVTTTSGQYTLSPLEQIGPSPKALKIPVAGTNYNVYVSFRLPTSSNKPGGVILDISNGSAASFLVTNNANMDAPLQVGVPYRIGANGPYVRVSSIAGNRASVSVSATATTPTETNPLPETNSSAGLSYTLTLNSALVSGELSFVEGKDIGPFVLTVKNVSSTTRSVTFPNNCWYTYTIYDGFNGGRSVFDLSSIQKCVSAESSTSKTFTLRPGDSFYIDIAHKFQTAHIPPGDYSMLIKLNTQLGAQSVAKFNFKVWGREPATNPLLYCSLATDKSSYVLGETITVKWLTSGTYGQWVKDTEKDNFYLGGDKLAVSGSSTFTANLLGNPYLLMRVYDAKGNTTTCRLVIPVSSVGTASPSISITSAGHVDADTATQFTVEYGNMPSSGVNVVNVNTGATVWTQELTSGGNGSLTLIVRPVVSPGEYVVQAFNSSRAVIATSARYTVGSVTPVPTVAIQITPSTISVGGSSTLTWTTQNANRCYMSYGSIQETVPLFGTWTINNTVTTRYTLRCVNDPGTGKDGPASEASATLTVSNTSSVGELYAVGVYEAQGSQHNFCYSKPGTVNVNLVQLVGTKKGTPITLSLSAYEPVIWNINVPTGVNLQKVILSGYNVQSPVITGASPLVERYFNNDPANAARGISPAASFYDEREGADSRFQTIYNWAGQATCANTSGAVPLASRWYYNGSSNYFYAYQKTDSNYSTLVSKLQSLTGLTLKNFQGAYSGSTFTVTVGTPEY